MYKMLNFPNFACMFRHFAAFLSYRFCGDSRKNAPLFRSPLRRGKKSRRPKNPGRRRKAIGRRAGEEALGRQRLLRRPPLPPLFLAAPLLPVWVRVRLGAAALGAGAGVSLFSSLSGTGSSRHS